MRPHGEPLGEAEIRATKRRYEWPEDAKFLVPDGVYQGTAILEDAGHGHGDFEITATVIIKSDTCHIAIKSPPQIPYFINSYEGNSHSGVYLGLMMFAQLPPPYNEGLYRCVTVDFGPKGTLCNAVEPAPHMNCTTTPMETLTDAVRLAFEKAMPAKVSAYWGHANGFNIAGWDTRTNEEYGTMVLATVLIVVAVWFAYFFRDHERTGARGENGAFVVGLIFLLAAEVQKTVVGDDACEVRLTLAMDEEAEDAQADVVDLCLMDPVHHVAENQMARFVAQDRGELVVVFDGAQ